MKKTVITLAIILGITIGASAQNRGLFDRGPNRPGYYDYNDREENSLLGFNLPARHGDPNDQEAPLGSGALMLIGFGTAYALKKRKKEI